jgi:Mg2+ and Co2+ transporter CorA
MFYDGTPSLSTVMMMLARRERRCYSSILHSRRRNMNETINGDSPAPESMLLRLRELRRVLLHLHKTLLDMERAAYEQMHGSVSRGELLQLVINHEQFAWLHSISELIVRIDEMLDAEEPATADDAESLLAQARSLLRPSETGDDFARKYYAALQRDPDAVLAHGEVTKRM